MKFKKILALGLVLALSGSTLTACGSSGSTAGDATSAAASASEASTGAGETTGSKDPVEITNVSYDPTRELYEAYNKLFAEHWLDTTASTRKPHSEWLPLSATAPVV